MEKTLTALPGLFLQNQSVGGTAAAKASFSSRLGNLVRGITALTSKHVGALGAGRSGATGGGPRAGRPESGGESPGTASDGAQGASVCHFPARTDSWESGFPGLALTLFIWSKSVIFESLNVS